MTILEPLNKADAVMVPPAEVWDGGAIRSLTHSSSGPRYIRTLSYSLVSDPFEHEPQRGTTYPEIVSHDEGDSAWKNYIAGGIFGLFIFFGLLVANDEGASSQPDGESAYAVASYSSIPLGG
ncbi:hypothetical protein N7326_01255 [Corynebacterium sp. ES2794-CONJ1]|uniref:hypothetical protein n=1 Tax=Corynebacterium sp. ES2794-CONJ1 TaxID=2980553 RepID=UPI0021D8486B|nr:hypothetical protein [Corynebacterium sp. ES2794-CONJ1]MCU9518497.1 hypothetical protein [Corynebacterium sp. ES2794-CONJ1]